MDVAEREAVDDLNLAAAEGRGHASLPHTADAGLVAAGPDLAALFEEAAAALGEIAAVVDAGAEPTVWRDVATDGADLVELAYAWLN